MGEVEIRSKDIRALVLDQNPAAAEALTASLRPDIVFQEVDYTSATHKAVQSFAAAPYHICFIAETFPIDELQVFFRDINKIQNSCVFVQVRKHVEQDCDRTQLKDVGFSFIVSRQGTYADRSGVKEVICDLLFAQKIDEKVLEVNDSMHLVLAEIDRAAEDLKRGRHTKINKLPIDFVEYLTNFDEKVLSEYYEALGEQAEEAQPNEVEKLDVPQRILSRQLPQLNHDTYTGASHRVWRKLKKKYGRTAEGSPVPETGSKQDKPDSEE